jgi:hypothetical protein
MAILLCFEIRSGVPEPMKKPGWFRASMIQGKHPTGPIPAGARSHAAHLNAWFGATRIVAAPLMRGGELSESQLTARM